MLAVEAVVIVGPQVAVWDVVLEHMPDHCEDGMGYSDGGTIFAPPGGNTLILWRPPKSLCKRQKRPV